MELRDKVAVVTGGASGIGKAVALRFAAEGAALAILGRSNEHGRQVEAELRERARQNGAGDGLYLHADVADSLQVKAALGAVIARWGHIDILVNNAAVMKNGTLVDTEEDDWELILGVNLRGPYLMAKYAIPAMPPGGAIINMSSVHAIATDANSAAYTASKGGLEALTRALALECHERGIRVNALRLGAVDTRMLWDNPEVKAGHEQLDPSDVGKPEQIAELTLFLASARSAFVSGAVLSADGGRLPILCGHGR